VRYSVAENPTAPIPDATKRGLNETYLVKGEGLAFVIAPTLDGPPPGSSGGFLGLTNSTGRATSGSSFVAVEFNTHYTTANN